MKNVIIIILLGFSLFANAIERIQNSFINHQDLVGKRVILPTYNDGVSKLNFVYDISVLKSGNFTYKSYSPLQVLGVPITIVSCDIINKDKKKKKALCLTVSDDNGHKAVLYFPMFIKKSDFVGRTISDLFYGAPDKITNSAYQYELSTISIPYFSADDVINYEKEFKDSVVFPKIGNEGIANREYKFVGFKFSKRIDFGSRTNLDTEFRYHVSTYYNGQNLRTHNVLDNLYAILRRGDRTYYLQINAVNATCGDNDGIYSSSLRKSLLSLNSYKNSFAIQYDSTKIAKLNLQFASKEMFFDGDRDYKHDEYVCISYDSIFSKYRTQSPNYFANRYIFIDGVKQVRLHDKNGNVFYNYHLVGKSFEPYDSTKIYVAFELKDDLLSAFKDGAKQRQIDQIEVKRKIKEEQEWQRQLAQDKVNYKNSLIRKYGKTNANIILRGEVKIGFTKDMCEEAWGEPEDINTTVNAYGTYEQWVYGIRCYLYFVGNKLVTIQN